MRLLMACHAYLAGMRVVINYPDQAARATGRYYEKEDLPGN